MKKITILAVAALAISFASCKKERTCTCTTTNTSTNGTVTTGTPRTTVYEKISKKDAQKQCWTTMSENNSITPTASTSKSDTKCELK